MGREVRRVPPNWEHPRYTKEDAKRPEDIGEYRVCFNEDYDTAAEKWIKELLIWTTGQHEGQIGEHPTSCKYYWEYVGSPPDEEYCRPKFTEEPTWFQMYETVSEGSPVSPPFSTEEELARYLSEQGDFWGQEDERQGRVSFRRKPTYEQALATVKAGWAPSMVFEPGKGILGPYEVATEK